MFFNINYIRGDNSVEGFTNAPRSLEQRTKDEVDGIERILALHKGARILDIPCGYGRHSIELAFRLYDVAGIDANVPYLKEAAARYNDRLYREDQHLMVIARHIGEKALRMLDKIQPPKLELKSGDMREITIQGEFDAVINMFYSFGFFEDEENEQAMSNFYRALKKGGQLLLHTDVSPEMISSGSYKDIGHTARRIRPTYIHSLQRKFPAATLHIEEKYDPDTKRIDGSWTVEEADGIKQKPEPYSVRVYSADEFVSLCRKAGFASAAVYGSWDKKPFSAASQEMIVHAVK